MLQKSESAQHFEMRDAVFQIGKLHIHKIMLSVKTIQMCLGANANGLFAPGTGERGNGLTHQLVAQAVAPRSGTCNHSTNAGLYKLNAAVKAACISHQDFGAIDLLQTQ